MVKCHSGLGFACVRSGVWPCDCYSSTIIFPNDCVTTKYLWKLRKISPQAQACRRLPVSRSLRISLPRVSLTCLQPLHSSLTPPRPDSIAEARPPRSPGLETTPSLAQSDILKGSIPRDDEVPLTPGFFSPPEVPELTAETPGARSSGWKASSIPECTNNTPYCDFFRRLYPLQSAFSLAPADDKMHEQGTAEPSDAECHGDSDCESDTGSLSSGKQQV